MNTGSSLWRMIGRLGCVAVAGQSLLLLALRLIYGGQFLVAGYGKLQHLEKVTAFFTHLGIPAPGFNAALVGTTEAVGGALLVIGLGTRLAAVPLVIAMIVAYLTAHAADAFNSLKAFTGQPPYQFLLASLILLAFGPGWASADALIRRRFRPRHPSTNMEEKEHVASIPTS